MADTKLPEVSVRLPKSNNTEDEPWYRYVTIDLIWYLLPH
jgi:hypothetical protein